MGWLLKCIFEYTLKYALIQALPQVPGTSPEGCRVVGDEGYGAIFDDVGIRPSGGEGGVENLPINMRGDGQGGAADEETAAGGHVVQAKRACDLAKETRYKGEGFLWFGGDDLLRPKPVACEPVVQVGEAGAGEGGLNGQVRVRVAQAVKKRAQVRAIGQGRVAGFGGGYEKGFAHSVRHGDVAAGAKAKDQPRAFWVGYAGAQGGERVGGQRVERVALGL